MKLRRYVSCPIMFTIQVLALYLWLATLPVPAHYGEIVLTEDHPVGFFVPAEKGLGLCSTALSIYLARLQNDFIESSWSRLQDDKFE